MSDWKLSDVYGHKASNHFKECLEDILTVMGGSVATLDEALTRAWNLAASRDCEIEHELFANQPALKASIIAGMMENRLPTLVADQLRTIGYPMWKPHKDAVARAGARAEAARAKQKIKDDERARAEQAAKLIIEAEQEKKRAEQAVIDAENRERESQRKEFFEWFRSQMQDNYLESEGVIPPVNLHVTQEDMDAERAEFVYSWLVKYVYGEDTKALTFDEEQALAIGSVAQHTLVTARAGSGKTQVIALRAVFMISHCGVDPKSMLLLTYNKAAQLEMANRIFDLLLKSYAIAKPKNEKDAEANKVAKRQALQRHGHGVPEVATIHSLAYRIAQAQRALAGHHGLSVLTDDERTGDKARTVALVRARRNFMAIDENFRAVKSFVLAHFSNDWVELLPALNTGPLSQLLLKENMPRHTMRGERVKSHGEKVIADFLCTHNVDYEYEKFLKDADSLGAVKPDFTIPDGVVNGAGLVIEYFGMHDNRQYEEDRTKKLSAYKRLGIPILDLIPSDIASGAYAGKIKDFLETHTSQHTKLRPLSVRELEDLVFQRQGETFFENTISQVISRARQTQMTPSSLRELGRSHSVHVGRPEVETLFLLASGIYAEYLRELGEVDANDFDGLVAEAKDAIETGQVSTIRGEVDLAAIKHIFLDEYQDFSANYHQFVEAIRSRTEAIVFAVGDDWQSINSYQGANPRIFEEFVIHYERAALLSIRTNRRSEEHIVAIGNDIMAVTGASPALPSKQRASKSFDGVYDLSRFEKSLHEKGRSARSMATKRVLLKVLSESSPNDDITILSRKRQNPVDYFVTGNSESRETLDILRDELTHGLSAHDRNRVTVTSAHAFKGKQSKHIIVWDADASSYPLVHNGWIYLQPFGVTLQAVVEEERRLMYVAVTRPETGLHLIYSGDISAFVSEALRTNLQDFPPPPDSSSILRDDTAILRVLNGHDAKETLKTNGFKWNAPERCWDLLVPLRTSSLANYSEQLLLTKPDWLREAGLARYTVILKGKNSTVVVVEGARK